MACGRANALARRMRLTGSTADGAPGLGLMWRGVCRPGWLSCIHSWLPWARPCRSPFRKTLEVRLRLHRYVAHRFEVRRIDHHVPGDQQAGPTCRPAFVETREAARGRLLGRREMLAHGRLGDAIGKDRATRQGERFVERGGSHCEPGVAAAGLDLRVQNDVNGRVPGASQSRTR